MTEQAHVTYLKQSDILKRCESLMRIRRITGFLLADLAGILTLITHNPAWLLLIVPSLVLCSIKWELILNAQAKR